MYYALRLLDPERVLCAVLVILRFRNSRSGEKFVQLVGLVELNILHCRYCLRFSEIEHKIVVLRILRYLGLAFASSLFFES